MPDTTLSTGYNLGEEKKIKISCFQGVYTTMEKMEYKQINHKK